MALLRSAATKRDARAYLSRLKPASEVTLSRSQEVKSPQAHLRTPLVNLGKFYTHPRAVQDRPIFSQYQDIGTTPSPQPDPIHIALVKIRAPEQLIDATVHGIAQTLSQLARLGTIPCIVLESGHLEEESAQTARSSLVFQADRVVAAIDRIPGPPGRRIDNLLTVPERSEKPEVAVRKLLLRPPSRGQIPVVTPTAYLESTQSIVLVSADDTMLALTREFAGLNFSRPMAEGPVETAEQFKRLQKQVSLDRIIILDPEGGMNVSGMSEERHVFINLAQECGHILDGLQSEVQKKNLELLRDVLSILPPAASALVTTPADAAYSGNSDHQSLPVSSVGTRRQRNALIHNLLTDRPVHSSSLPRQRLGYGSKSTAAIVTSQATFVKRGMPLTILPDPSMSTWVPDTHGRPRLQLTDPRIDLPRLIHLIDDSFNRKLDIREYLRRVDNRLAGIVIAGEYEVGALLTWETPPGSGDGDITRLVPYLDKFAVLKRSQGAGGVADIVFNAMVQDCFPNGVCWRSRRNNPVNKWYFERARGSWRIPKTNWTMFWTTEGVVERDQIFQDYEGVCRSVVSSWADEKAEVD